MIKNSHNCAGKKQSNIHHFTKNPFIIAETSYNHEGDLKYLYNMIDEISELRINAVKFHLLLNIDSYMVKTHPLYSQLQKWLFTIEQWNEIYRYSKNKGLEIIALCDDIDSVKYIINKKMEIFGIEIHATSINDYFMLNEVAKFSGIIILGIGGVTEEEIRYAINFLRNENKHNIILMYGFQNYPTNYADINLSKMIAIKNQFNLPVGYADHTGFNDPYNEIISVSAGLMGFPILEKHFTLDFGKKRVDYEAAVGKIQMKKIKELMNIALIIHGNEKKKMSAAEKKYGVIGPMKKAIVAKTNIKKGEQLSVNNLCFKRTDKKSSINQNQFLQLLNFKVKNDISKDELIEFNKIIAKSI